MINPDTVLCHIYYTAYMHKKRILVPSKVITLAPLGKTLRISTHFVNFNGVVVAWILQETGHRRIPWQCDLGCLDQHDADVVDGRGLHGSFGSGHGYVDKLPAFRGRQIADSVFRPYMKFIRGNRTQAAYRYLGIVEYLLDTIKWHAIMQVVYII